MSCCVVHGHSREQYRRSVVCGGGGRWGGAESPDFVAERDKRHPHGPQHPRRGPRTDGLAAASFSTPGSICDTTVLHDASQFRTLRHRWVLNTDQPRPALVLVTDDKNRKITEGKLGLALTVPWLTNHAVRNDYRADKCRSGGCQRALTCSLGYFLVYEGTKEEMEMGIGRECRSLIVRLESGIMNFRPLIDISFQS